MWEGFIRCCMMMYWPPHRTLFHWLSRDRTSLDRVVKAVIPPACLLDGLVFTLTCNSNRATVRKWQKFRTKKVLFVFVDKPASNDNYLHFVISHNFSFSLLSFGKCRFYNCPLHCESCGKALLWSVRRWSTRKAKWIKSSYEKRRDLSGIQSLELVAIILSFGSPDPIHVYL